MSRIILRQYLEITSIEDLKDIDHPGKDYHLNLISKNEFQLNKFLYKQIGKKYNWVDRLEWTDDIWINYVSNKNLFTFILKKKDDLVGYSELIIHKDKKEIEIAYFGLLEEFRNKKLGSYLLSEAIKKSFLNDIKRVWAHTCSLDHKNALNNYIARGMKIFKTETIVI